MIDSLAVLKRLKTRISTPTFIAMQVLIHANRKAKDLFQSGAREGTVVIAE